MKEQFINVKIANKLRTLDTINLENITFNRMRMLYEFLIKNSSLKKKIGVNITKVSEKNSHLIYPVLLTKNTLTGYIVNETKKQYINLKELSYENDIYDIIDPMLILMYDRTQKEAHSVLKFCKDKKGKFITKHHISKWNANKIYYSFEKTVEIAKYDNITQNFIFRVYNEIFKNEEFNNNNYSYFDKRYNQSMILDFKTFPKLQIYKLIYDFKHSSQNDKRMRSYIIEINKLSDVILKYDLLEEVFFYANPEIDTWLRKAHLYNDKIYKEFSNYIVNEINFGMRNFDLEHKKIVNTLSKIFVDNIDKIDLELHDEDIENMLKSHTFKNILKDYVKNAEIIKCDYLDLLFRNEIAKPSISFFKKCLLVKDPNIPIDFGKQEINAEVDTLKLYPLDVDAFIDIFNKTKTTFGKQFKTSILKACKTVNDKQKLREFFKLH